MDERTSWKTKVNKKCVALCCTVTTGVFLFIFACAYNAIFDAILHSKMRQMLALSPDCYSYHYWKFPPVPVTFHMYVFDIVNPEEIMQGLPPVVLEKGPYTYQVTLEKFNVTFNDNNTVSYRQKQTYHFKRELSVGDESDTFTTTNFPLFASGVNMQWVSPTEQEAVNLLMEALGEEPLIKLTVREIFWGYNDSFLHLAKEWMDKLHIHSDIITGVFGYYVGKNGTDDGLYTIHTGTDDLSKYLLIDRWNGMEVLNTWNTPIANTISGTDGSEYPPFVTEDRVPQMFDSNLLRTLSMVFKERTSVRGVDALKFVIDDSEFANATVNPRNAGFCTPLDHCMPSGVLNASAMGNGAPLYVSMPHFLGADPYYHRLVRGLRPNRDLHQTYFDIHPLTGVCLAAGRRYQLNVQTKEIPFLTKTHGMSLAYIPTLWIDGIAGIDDDTRNEFYNGIQMPLAIMAVVHDVMYGLGPVMVIVPILCYVIHRRRKARKGRQSDVNGVSPPSYGSTADSDVTSPLLINNSD